MVRYTHPEMFYIFIPLILALFWYVYKGKKLRMGLETLGTSSIKKACERFLVIKKEKIWTQKLQE